jgi:predicted alpha-1,2-mannosidase
MRRLMPWVSVGSLFLLVVAAVTASVATAPNPARRASSGLAQPSSSEPATAKPSSPAPKKGTGEPRPAQFYPARLVDTFVGTGSSAGAAVTGAIGTFPGAAVPFGMVQWSPDTSPDRAQGGGYDYSDTHISGFSLTHLSGAGCSVFGDIPVLPTTGSVPRHPEKQTESFSHLDESAAPGYYQVGLGSPATSVQLSATIRSGIGQMVFPSRSRANILFKVTDSATAVHAASVQIDGANEVTGSVTTGYFCSSLGTYTLHFVAIFNRPFARYGVWQNGRLHPGTSMCSGSSSKDCGAWVSFNTTKNPVVTMKVGVSYVSAANAASNLKVEDPGWSLSTIAHAASQSWNEMLGRIAVQGGGAAEQQTFYTALYHSLLDPSVFSDDNGQYEGFDGRVHSTHGRIQYANFSEWDIYRSEIPLLSMIDPSVVSGMVQSLLNDASQDGWLPTWAVANSDSGVMNGDSADPIIADAYAFGARGFNVDAALKAMLKGADHAGTGPNYVEERPSLAQYKQLGYVPQLSYIGTSPGIALGASESLEYAIDDFAIAQIAKGAGDTSAYQTMMARSQNWQNLFNPATGSVQARLANGSFPTGPVVPTPSAYYVNENQGQAGFEEGNAAQYTWAVPQDLGSLFALMGGDAAATSNLETFFSQLTDGPFLPYDWPGNEPNLWTPWEFDFSGAPWRTQGEVRQIASSLYFLTPKGEPGNDDLGALSSWYVWAALGLYPVTPGTANLALASPMFSTSTIYLADGKTLTISAQGTPGPFVQSASVSIGSNMVTPLNQPWLPASILHTGGAVDFTLGPSADQSWGSSPDSAPPSYTDAAAPAVGFTIPSGTVNTQVSVSDSVTLGVQSDQPDARTIFWTASAPDLIIAPSSGEFVVPAESMSGQYPQAQVSLQVLPTSPGNQTIQFAFSVLGSTVHVPSVSLQVDTGG